MALSSKIKALCDEKSIAVGSLERALGVGNGSFRKDGDMGFSKICMVADYFNIPLDYFRDDRNLDNYFATSEEERAVIRAYREVSDEKKGDICLLLRLKRESTVAVTTQMA